MKYTNYDEFAEIYDFEYVNYHANLGDFPFYKKLCQGEKNILDLGCGTGRIALELAKESLNVTGIDLSQEMLKKAKAKISCNENLRVNFIHADMINYNLNKEFDIIYIGFRSFMLLLSKKEQRETLLNAYKHLAKNGKLVISMFVPSLKRLIRYQNADSEYCFVREFPFQSNIVIKEFEKRWMDEYNQIGYHNLKHCYVDQTSGVTLKEVSRFLSVRWTYKYEFAHLAELCDFNVETLYGDYYFSVFNENCTEMIWILNKKDDGS